jgi:hypothetical protein
LGPKGPKLLILPMELLGAQTQHTKHQVRVHFGLAFDPHVPGAIAVFELRVGALGTRAIFVTMCFMRLKGLFLAAAGVVVKQRHVVAAARVVAQILGAVRRVAQLVLQ